MNLFGKLLILDKFLKENNIDYFLIGGSVLGAVRHGGFIPWDDDVDIGMSRKDFERFESLNFDKLEQEKLLYCPIGKNVILNAPIGYLYDRSDEDIDFKDCATIDIFPIDFVPENKVKQKLQRISSFIYHLSVGRSPAQNRGRKAYLFTKVVVKITPGFMFNAYERFSKWLMLKLAGDSSPLIANIFGMKGYYREIMPYEYVFPTEERSFEGHSFSVPGQVDKYLTALYGDYMKLPPEDKRKPEHKYFD